MNGIIVEAKGIRKTYRTSKVEVPALRGIDMHVGEGEMVAIMGQSGCGKTTLLNCLAGLDNIDDGQVLISGQDIHMLSDGKRSDYRAQKMGFIFQFFNLLSVLSAVENVEMPLLVVGVSAGDARRKAEAILAQVGLTDRLHHKPPELSGGGNSNELLWRERWLMTQ